MQARPRPGPAAAAQRPSPSRRRRWRCAFARQEPRALATVEWALQVPVQVGTPLPAPPGDWEARGHRLETSQSLLRPLGVTLNLTGSWRAASSSRSGFPGHPVPTPELAASSECQAARRAPCQIRVPLQETESYVPGSGKAS